MRTVIDGLFNASVDFETAVIAATHSPLLLEPQQVDLYRISRSASGHAQLMPEHIDVADEIRLEATLLALGMARTDAPSLIRRIIVVEGIHDVHVFERLLRSSLGGGQLIVPMHGASHARSLADQNLLLSLTETPILAILDNVQNEKVQRAKLEMQLAVDDRDLTRADEIAASLVHSSKDEEGTYLASLFRLAIQKGLLDRIDVHGLEMPDVICYLPEDLMLERPGENWVKLESEWRKRLNDGKKGTQKTSRNG